MARSIPCMIVRGGTSKGVYIAEQDLPADAELRDATILSLFGSPDRRQIDGLGGADPLTSKVCLIGPAPQHGEYAGTTDLTYTFGQVSIDQPSVDYGGLCGNLTAGLGVYALWRGLVSPVAPLTSVRIYNTNLGRRLVCEVPVKDGEPLEHGDFTVPGVPGTGPQINVDFADTAGGATNALLPTGNTTDILTIAGADEVEVSMLDIGNACVFLRAADVGLTGTETATEIDADTALVERLEALRAQAAHAMGMIDDPKTALRDSPAVPLLAMVAPPRTYRSVSDDTDIDAGQCDLLGRMMFMQRAHKAYAATGSVCTGVASRLPGTIVHEVCTQRSTSSPVIRIGHPAGVVDTEAVVATGSDGVTVKRATIGRTARRLMDGAAFIR